MLTFHGRCLSVGINLVESVVELLFDLLLSHLSGPGAPHFEGGSGSVEPLVLVGADNFGGTLVFVAASAGHPGHSGGLVGSMSRIEWKDKVMSQLIRQWNTVFPESELPTS